MPRGDGTGPAGMGPMTGRAAGYCAGNSVPGFAGAAGGRGLGFGLGRGRGGGRGWRNWFYATGLPGWQRAGAGIPAYGAYGVPAYGAGGAYAGPPMTRQQELDALKSQAEYFQGALEGISKQISDLQNAADEKKK